MAGPLSKAWNAVRRATGFAASIDAIDQANKRRDHGGRVRSADEDLLGGRRRKLIATARGISRNFALAAWAIRKHLDFVASFSFQARTGDEQLDQRLEDLMAWWARPANFDAAGRHGLHKLIRLAEAARCVDGDVALMKLANGTVQAIEGDRIQDPAKEVNRDWKVVNGVRVNKAGRPLAYAIHARDERGGLEFERWVRSSRIVHHGWFDRIDQVRGISPIAAALNSYQDVYENFDYTLAKLKVSQLFGIAFYRDAADGLGSVEQSGHLGADDSDGDATDEGYNVKFGTRPLVLDLEPGDRAEFLESNSPSNEFQSFTQAMISVAIKSLDIPYSFYDESHTNFFGSMAALRLYLKSAQAKRDDVREVLRKLTVWRLGLFIQDGVLELPDGMGVADIPFEWIGTGLPWFRANEEMAAAEDALRLQLRTRSEIRRELYGDDWRTVARQLADERDYLESLGLPTDFDAGNVSRERATDEDD